MKGREVEEGEVTKEESNEALRADAGPAWFPQPLTSGSLQQMSLMTTSQSKFLPDPTL